jgi:hypothetical protein
MSVPAGAPAGSGARRIQFCPACFAAYSALSAACTRAVTSASSPAMMYAMPGLHVTFSSLPAAFVGLTATDCRRFAQPHGLLALSVGKHHQELFAAVAVDASGRRTRDRVTSIESSLPSLRPHLRGGRPREYPSSRNSPRGRRTRKQPCLRAARRPLPSTVLPRPRGRQS